MGDGYDIPNVDELGRRAGEALAAWRRHHKELNEIAILIILFDACGRANTGKTTACSSQFINFLASRSGEMMVAEHEKEKKSGNGGAIAAAIGSALLTTAEIAYAMLGSGRTCMRTPIMGGGGRKQSFAAGTKVLLADGSHKPIEKVKVGDTVLATDPETGLTSAQRVTELHVNRDTELTDLTVQDSRTGGKTVLHTTQEHPFWDETRRRWISASQLPVGHRLYAAGAGGARVVAVKNFSGVRTMYNLTVSTIHTYYVLAGNTPILVHNDGGDDLVRVGRWMSQGEYDAMLRTGKVQSGGGGVTYVVHPASPDAFTPNRPGSVYAEFDVPRSSLIPGGRPGDYKMADPDTLMGRYLAKKGGTPGMPRATNISGPTC